MHLWIRKMKTYLLQIDDNVLDESLFNVLNSMSIEFETLTLSSNHQEINPLFNKLEGGIVFLPAMWKDLFCVKVVQEISLIPTSFETIIVDTVPEVSNLIVAFNEGLSAYLETPVTEEKFQLTISRVRSRFEDKISQLSTTRRLSSLSAQSISLNTSQAVIARNQYLGRAFIDMVKQTGPLFENKIEVLLTSSSSVQQKQMESVLNAIGISTIKTGSIEEAIQIAEKNEFPVVISDNFLPDGDAIKLANRIRKISKQMPHIIVWSSSPDKAATLLKPESHIDEVLLKPGPEVGIETILPSIIAVIYRA